MSDCSTNAMLPKDQPSDEQIDKYVLHFGINDPDEYMRQVSEVEINDCKFIDTQRYQQLEQVAQGMLSFIERFEQTAYEKFFEQLKALGVSVDESR